MVARPTSQQARRQGTTASDYTTETSANVPLGLLLGRAGAAGLSAAPTFAVVMIWG